MTVQRNTIARSEIVLLICSVFLALIVAEVLYGVFFAPAADHYAGYPRFDVVHDEKIGWDIPPNMAAKEHYYNLTKSTIWSNSLGCFDEAANLTGDKYIYLAGDSFTWGFSPFRDKYGTVLERLLNTPVSKCGVVAYGAKQSFLKAKKTIGSQRDKPFLIVLGYYWNDLTDDYLFPRNQVRDGYRVSKLELKDLKTGEIQLFSDEYIRAEIDRATSWWRRTLTSKIFGALSLKVNRLAGGDAQSNDIVMESLYLSFADANRYKWLENAWESHLQGLLEFDQYAKSIGARFLVVLVPVKEQIYPKLDTTTEKIFSTRDPAGKVLKFLSLHGIPSLDLTAGFRAVARADKTALADDDLYWQRDIHWNPRGNHLAGALLADYLVRSGSFGVRSDEEVRRRIKSEFNALGSRPETQR